MSVNFSFISETTVCRFCSEKGAEISLQSSLETENEVNLLLNNITFCLGIELQLEKQPKTICKECKSKIENFAYFKKLCLESEENLQRVAETENLKSDEKAIDHLEHDIKADLHNNFDDDESIKNCDLDTEILCNLDEFSWNDTNDDNAVATEPTINDNSTAKKKIPIISPHKRKVVRKKEKPSGYCTICFLDLESDETLVQHKFECHGIDKNGLYKCLGCDKTFTSPKSRTSHEQNFCKNLKDGYICTICDRFLPMRRYYERHMRGHRNNGNIDLPEKMFHCYKCQMSFKTKNTLKAHLDGHDKTKYICESCGRAFSRRDYLNKHMRVHLGIRLHACPHCDYRASQKSSLNVHIRKHTGERPYCCDICSQRCVNKSNLAAHLKRHAGIKRFECTICPKKYGYKSSLDEHIASCHERSVQHICSICGAIYTRVTGLRRHLAAKHGKKMHMSRVSDDATNEEMTDKIIITQGEKDIYMKIVSNEKEGSYVMKEDQIFVVQSDISCGNT